MNKINVRCCCQPQKVLGTLEVYDLRPTQRVMLMPRLTAVSWNLDAVPEVAHLDERPIIQIKMFVDHQNGIEELAVYSDDRPMEFWRSVRGFIEADMVVAA